MSVVPSRPTPVARSTVRHRREVVWQIALPMLLAAAGGAALMYVSAAGAPEARSAVADVSLIYLMAPALVAGLVGLAVVSAGCGLLFVALRELPPVLRRGLDYARLAAARTRTVADRVTGSLTSTRTLLASVRDALAELRAGLAGRRED
jgi:hypothetical protein